MSERMTLLSLGLSRISFRGFSRTSSRGFSRMSFRGLSRMSSSGLRFSFLSSSSGLRFSLLSSSSGLRSNTRGSRNNKMDSRVLLRNPENDVARRLSRGITKGKIFRKLPLFLLISMFFTNPIFASDDVPIKLEHVSINVQNKASLMRGAKFFANNCMACHTMKYLAYNNLAKKAGITLDKMPLKNKEWFLGIVPPDLTLIVSQKGADWVYTYLHSFYNDPGRPTGTNNLLFKNVNMTNILAPYQGQQELTPFGKQWLTKKHHSIFSRKPPYYRVLIRVKSGSMSQEEYDKTIKDLVNFLAYASEPHRVEREHIGFWVLLFLAVLFVFAYLLKKSYWKDVDK